jgi:hypothetical protein
MKKINFNHIWLMLALSFSLTACLKDKGWENGEYGSVRNTDGERFVSMGLGGLNNFAKSSILINTTSADVKTVEIVVNLDVAEPTAQTIKIGVDNSLIATYNAANNKNFQPVTSDMYKFAATEIVIPAGELTGKTTMEIYQNKFDPSKSYLIPVTIIEAPGAKLSSNLNTRYFNIIGNPLAGSYSWTYRRYQQADTSGAPNGGGSFVNQTVTIPPVSETVLLFPDSYTQTFINPTGGFLLSFKNTNGVLSNFTVTLDAKSLADYPGAGFTLGKGATLLSANIVGDATTQYKGSTFSFYIQYINSTGGVRTLINTFTKL